MNNLLLEKTTDICPYCTAGEYNKNKEKNLYRYIGQKKKTSSDLQTHYYIKLSSNQKSNGLMTWGKKNAILLLG